MNINELIKQITDISASPKKSSEEAAKKTGKSLVGWVEPYAPEEIIYAAGCIPVALWGGQVELKKVRTYLPPFACSIMQSTMELALNGEYDNLKAVIVSSPCDTLKCIGQIWKGNVPCIHFAHPMNRKLDCANTFLVSEYKMISDKLEEILNVKITDEDIAKSIIVYNEYRSTMRAFVKLAASYPNIITPKVRHNIIKAGMFIDKADYTVLIKKLTNELRKQSIVEFKGKKVVLTGITFEPDEILEILEFYNLSVVADDLAQESRQFRTDVPYYGKAMESLAKMWQNHNGCSLAFDPFKERIQMLVEMVRSTGADGLVYGQMKFCDPEEYDLPILMKACEKAEIPLLVVEIDQQSNAFEQIKTRIQGFAENL